MRDLPTGTVTFLFTDIEGSTRLLHELGIEAYAQALAEHRRLLRDAFAARGGVEVDTQGDAFFIAFADPAQAIQAATEAQQQLADGPVLVRIGLHTGTPHVGAEGYVGADVHLGARIAAAGHGGQVLLSGATREAIDDAVELVDLGEHRLKDFDQPVWIYQLGKGKFPPLKTISNTNLPRPASAFVGRNRELREITKLLRDAARLVTLTGPGGTGKTRLSLEVAAQLVSEFRNGTFWVDLAPLTDPALVPASIAQTLGAKADLADHIGQREMLLVLDNLEQVVESAPEVSRLVAGCPKLRVLATSRERLRVRGETEYAVPPLTLDEAVELFATRSGLQPEATMAELCRRLDNLPLAVELAAARASVLSPAQIVARLSQRLDVLKGGRDAEARQQTLRATIEWSYDLLSNGEKQLFTRLGVFAGGWTLEAAEQIADADLDSLQALVDKSLVRHAGERFSMLETIREYALEKLGGEADEMKNRHAHYFLDLGEKGVGRFGYHAADSIALLEVENDNLRAAMDTVALLGDRNLVIRLAAALGEFWSSAGHVVEGKRRLAEALEIEGAPPEPRAWVLLAAADISYRAGDIGEAQSRAIQALDSFRQLGSAAGAAGALNILVVCAIDRGDFEQATRMAQESVDLFRQAGDDKSVVAATRTLGFAFHAAGQLESARVIHEANLARARQLGYAESVAGTLGSLSMIAAEQGRVPESIALARENVVAARELGSIHPLAQSLCRAANLLTLSLGKPAAAAAILGFFDTLQEQIGVSEAWVQRMNDETMTSIRSQLGEPAEREASQRGQRLPLGDSVALALSELDDAGRRRDVPTGGAGTCGRSRLRGSPASGRRHDG